MNRCPDLVVCLKRDLQCLRPEASLVLIYRPNVAGMKGRVDLAQPVNRTPDLWCGSTIHYHSILFEPLDSHIPRKAEEDRRKAEEDRRNAEEDRRKAEEDRRKAEEDRREIDRRKGEIDRRKGEEDRRKGEEERRKGEEDRRKGEEERKKAEETRLREKELERELARLSRIHTKAVSVERINVRVNSDNERTGEGCNSLDALMKSARILTVNVPNRPEGGWVWSCILHATPHDVYRSEKSTTKLRTVFNASSPSTSGNSLNSIQFNGGLVQGDLFSIMVRFRKHKYAFTTDIEKMFRMINIHPEQTCLQGILWKKGIGEPIKTYELTTVTYVTVSATYLATRTLKQLAMDEADNFPLTAPVMMSDSYMDDILSGSESIEKIIGLQHQLIEMFKTAGMHLHKW
ncbi:integrase catalytic domain-containing protein [Trichonephila clavipes]|nr:integrase catalytic domain-containing protein [Trichonephila clavipes]